MIRPAVLSDKNDMQKLFSALNLFNNNELEFMTELVDSYFNQTLGEGHYWVVGEDKTIVSAASERS